MATIEIDGKPYQAEPGQMVIEIADANGIDIPRFCYHKKLSIAANCRMCLVDVEKAPKPMPACATPIMDGMKVWTKSPKALMAQKAVMEFLLINHPLDCPICDQGGECELQDIAVGYGKDISRYQEGKRVVMDKNIGPLIATEMTRCIHCTRCVRFGEEIAGIPELGATGRGEHTRIGTYIERSVNSELSGNVIDLCPVGALTSKPFRFSARAWEIQQREGIAPHDGLGSNIYFHIQRNQVKRVVPKENEAINEVWLADRDRFSYEGLKAPDRLIKPMIKKAGQWQETDWESALQFAAEGLKKVLDAKKSLGALASPTATVEELYLLQKWLRGMGSQHIDHRLKRVDFSDQESAPLFPWLGQSIHELEHCDAALIIGSHLRKEQPLLNHRLRKAVVKRGAKVMFVNPLEYEFNFPVAEQIVTKPSDLALTLAEIAKALLDSHPAQIPTGLTELVAAVVPTEAHIAIAQHLINGTKKAVLVGSQVANHPDASVLRALAQAIADLSGAHYGCLAEASNSAGAWVAGVVPHRAAGGVPVTTPGLNAQAMLTQGLSAFVLLGLEPELDSCLGTAAVTTLQKADFVVSLTAYRTEVIESYASVMLPIALFAETSGTYINQEGKWQSFAGAVPSLGESRPAWKILRVLGNILNVNGFDYMTSEQVRDELKAITGDKWVSYSQTVLPAQLPMNGIKGLQRVTEVPIYAVDALVRRAAALQRTDDAKITVGVHINSTVAQALGITETGIMVQVKQNGSRTDLPVVIDERVPTGCALIYAGQAQNAALSDWHGPIEVSL